ncbi:MAG: hypothetical protein H2057_08045 [Alphaproteobacteria bacterium]|nr:hypothetical protein [Alphaproteobacteria bacterium]
MSGDVITKGYPAPPRVWESVGVGLKFLFSPTSYYLKLILVMGLFFVVSALLCAYANPTWGILTGIIGLFLWGGFNARLVRHVTLGETKVNMAGPLARGYFWLSIVADIVQAVLAYLAMIPGFVIFIVVGGALGIAFTQPSLDAVVASNPGLNGVGVLFLVGAFLLILIPCCFVALRTLYLSNHVTAQRGFDIEGTYKMTQGKVWRLVGLVLLMRGIIPTFILSVLAVIFIMVMGVSFSFLLEHGGTLNPDTVPDLMDTHVFSYVIHGVIFLLMLVNGMWVVAGAHYYQGLYEAA